MRMKRGSKQRMATRMRIRSPSMHRMRGSRRRRSWWYRGRRGSARTGGGGERRAGRAESEASRRWNRWGGAAGKGKTGKELSGFQSVFCQGFQYVDLACAWLLIRRVHKNVNWPIFETEKIGLVKRSNRPVYRGWKVLGSLLGGLPVGFSYRAGPVKSKTVVSRPV
jgi:hypothetical protein